MFDIDGLLLKTDLTALAERAGGKFHKSGSETRGACPIHGGHNTEGFAIYNKGGKQLWTCFSGDCGGGDAVSFVQRWQNVDFKRACEFLGAETQSDPTEMARLSLERASRAKADLDAAIAKANAARAELQAAEQHLVYHANRQGVPLWEKRGIPEDWQQFWYLGYREDYSYLVDGSEYHTPSLTIPLLDESRLLLNIKHRLLNPAKPNDKYRPERAGLGAMPPFIAVPEMGYDGEWVIVTEGEIKSMVLCARTHEPDWQYIGVPGRSNFSATAKKLVGKKAIFIPDPDARGEAYVAAKSCGGRVLEFPFKIDDYVLRHELGKDWLHGAILSARVAK